MLNVTQNPDGTGQGSGQLAGSGAVALTGSGSMYYNSTAASTFSGDITAPSGGLEVDSGTLILSGTNNFAAGAAVRGGTLVLADNQALADGSSVYVGSDLSEFGTVVSAPAVAASPQPAGLNGPAPVPEPGTIVLLAAGGTIVLLRRRRHRKPHRAA